MNALVVVAIVVIVALAALMVVAASRRGEMGSATGQLSRETLKRDESRRKELATTAPGGRTFEKAAMLATRDGDALVPAASSATPNTAPASPTAGSASASSPCPRRPCPRRTT